jgi:hypothetical protein
MSCLLCQSNEVVLKYQKEDPHVGHREYFKCSHCSLIYVPPKYHLNWSDQKERYDQHQNNPDDPGYQKFLNKLLTPLKSFLKKGDQGLDYGCGPGPAISPLFTKDGFHAEDYDPIYKPDQSLLNQKYDFVTCTEVVEHFSDVLSDWKKMMSLVKSGGVIGVMTEFVPEDQKLADWYYIKDPTHICFYSPKVFQWVAKEFHLEILSSKQNVVIFRKL